MPHRMREPAGDPLEVGENPVAPLIMQAVEGGREEAAVIHRKNLNGSCNRGRLGPYLERFQDCCRAGIGSGVIKCARAGCRKRALDLMQINAMVRVLRGAWTYKPAVRTKPQCV